MADLIGALSTADDPDGMGLIAFAIIKNLKGSEGDVERIRFVKWNGQSTANGELLFEAAVVMVDGERTIVPIMDPMRTVPPFTASSESESKGERPKS